MTDTATTNPSEAATAATTTENNNETADIMLLPAPRLEVLSFAVSIPASTTMDTIAFDDDYYDDDDEGEEHQTGADSNDPLAVELKRKPPQPPKAVNTSSMNGIGMVGTIIVLKTSYIVWFGWGQIDDNTSSTSKGDNDGKDELIKGRVGVNNSRILGSQKGSQSNNMGQFLIAMPPRKYGATTAESSTSKLIGSEYNDDDMIARPMACRLSQKCGRPVLVSCQLDPTHIQSIGLDPDLLHGRAAALAEKRIWELLKPYHDQ